MYELNQGSGESRCEECKIHGEVSKYGRKEFSAIRFQDFRWRMGLPVRDARSIYAGFWLPHLPRTDESPLCRSLARYGARINRGLS